MPGFPQGHALVVGVGEYSDPLWNVPSAARDAQALAAVLKDPRAAAYNPSQVDLLLNSAATRDGVARALQRLADRTKPDSIVLISFTCHGAKGSDNLYYLATADVGFTADGQIVAGSGYSISQLAAALKAIPARRLLLLVNACFAGEVGVRLGIDGLEPDEPLFAFGSMLPDEAGTDLANRGEGRAIITAGKADQRSFLRTDQPHSFFGQALIEAVGGAGVNGSSGYVGLSELYDSVYVQVAGAARQQLGEAQDPVLTILQNIGPFPVASYQGQTGDERRISQRPSNGVVRELPPITINVTNKRSVISFDGATVMGDVRTGHVVEGDLTIIGAERSPQPEEEPQDPRRKLPMLRARIEVARNVDEDARDEAALRLKQAERALERSEPERAIERLDEALFILRGMNNAYINSVVRKLEALVAQL